MGKNQQYKAMQRSRVGGSSGGPDSEIEDGMVDGSFHSPEWHAARLASLKTSHTVTWEEYKKKQKVKDEIRKGELEADKDKMMREYRAQLDAERAIKLAKGRNHSSGKSSHKKDKDKDSKKRSSKRKRCLYKYSALPRSRRSSDSSSSSSSSESSSSEDEEDRESRRSKSRSKKRKKEKKHRSRFKHDDKEAAGPLPLSRFFGNLKD